VAKSAALDITNHHQASFKWAIKDDGPLPILSPDVFEFEARVWLFSASTVIGDARYTTVAPENNQHCFWSVFQNSA